VSMCQCVIVLLKRCSVLHNVIVRPQCDHMVQRLEVLRERLTSTEKFIDAELDHRRVLLAESAPAVPVQASTGEPAIHCCRLPLGSTG